MGIQWAVTSTNAQKLHPSNPYWASRLSPLLPVAFGSPDDWMQTESANSLTWQLNFLLAGRKMVLWNPKQDGRGRLWGKCYNHLLKKALCRLPGLLFLLVNKVIFRDGFLRKYSLSAEIVSLVPVQVSGKIYGEVIFNLSLKKGCPHTTSNFLCTGEQHIGGCWK